MRDDCSSEDEDAQTGREASSSQVHSDDGVTLEEHEGTYSESEVERKEYGALRPLLA